MRACFLVAFSIVLAPAPLWAQDADALRARHAALRAKLADNPFGRPLHVESSESGGAHKGEIYAVVDQPFTRVGPALRHSHQWCELLILQANVKNCEPQPDSLRLFVGRKHTDAAERAYRADFSYEVRSAGADYLQVALDAPQGPMGTTDYRIRLEAAPLDATRSFVHLAYSYTLGSAARMGMQLYLSSSGRDKVGFSVVDRTADGRPVYVGGVRGVVERNTMRYYLAIESYLATLGAPVAERTDQRLRAFHAALERYPRQLRELELEEYLAMKRPDAARVAQAHR